MNDISIDCMILFISCWTITDEMSFYAKLPFA